MFRRRACKSSGEAWRRRKQSKCPICGKPVEREGNAWLPFCSNRCKLVDLSKWLNEEYRVPSHDEDEGDGEIPPDDDRTENLH